MGGDGGTISSNRVYLRGAGKASHTADHPSNAHKRAQVEDAERARLTLTTCAVSGTGIEFAPSSSSSSSSRTRSSTSGADIVACPHGKLYKREKALEALLQRSQSSSLEDGSGALGLHIRGMRDLHPVRFQVVDASSSSSTSSSSKGMTATKNGNGKQHKNYVPVCPITGSEIGSGNVTFFLIVRSKKEKNIAGAAIENKEEDDVVEDGPNVLSERAIKEMGIAGLQSEYGPFEEQDMIRLAPPKSGGVFEEIQKKWAARMEDERLAKLQKKKDKKRKRNDDNPKKSHTPSSSTPKETTISSNGNITHKKSNNSSGKGEIQQRQKKSAADEARTSVQSAVAQSSVLSSLFGAGKKVQSEKEKRNALFTRNC